jgi:cytochrome c553
MASGSPVGKWEERLSRWGAPVTYVAAVVTIGLVLVAVITRSPDTKANYQESASGYDRTPLASIGGVSPYLGLRRDPVSIDDPAHAFVQAGCASCHGLRGQGAAVGPPIWKIDAQRMAETLRDGGAGMPSFAADRLSDVQIASLAAYLNEWRKQHPNDPETKPVRAGSAAGMAP